MHRYKVNCECNEPKTLSVTHSRIDMRLIRTLISGRSVELSQLIPGSAVFCLFWEPRWNRLKRFDISKLWNPRTLVYILSWITRRCQTSTARKDANTCESWAGSVDPYVPCRLILVEEDKMYYPLQSCPDRSVSWIRTENLMSVECVGMLLSFQIHMCPAITDTPRWHVCLVRACVRQCWSSQNQIWLYQSVHVVPLASLKLWKSE
jgi:hypothetical protein